MNMINQVLLEGKIDSFEFKKDPAHDDFLDLRIVYEVTEKNKDGTFTTLNSYFNVYAFGILADYCKKRLKLKRGVRIVGKLKQERCQDSDSKTYSRVFIVAEHIEFKPMKEDFE